MAETKVSILARNLHTENLGKKERRIYEELRTLTRQMQPLDTNFSGDVSELNGTHSAILTTKCRLSCVDFACLDMPSSTQILPN